MSHKKDWFYVVIFVLGIFAILGGLLHHQIATFLIPATVVVTSYSWLVLGGVLFTIAGLFLWFGKKYEIGQSVFMGTTKLEAIVTTILIISVAGVSGWLYGQYQKTLLVSTDNIARGQYDNVFEKNPVWLVDLFMTLRRLFVFCLPRVNKPMGMRISPKSMKTLLTYEKGN